MIVRLKAIVSAARNFILTSFNSMIVRLKDEYRGWNHLVRVFQFYDSPIKSSLFVISLPLECGFNSMIVRLKVQFQRLSLYE